MTSRIERAAYGVNLFAYNNIKTNQVIYSLKQTLDNNAAIKQLPYAGKNTKPAKLRKDIWRPFLSVSFPSAPQGLHAFRKLREYRRLHELNWDTEDAKRLAVEYKTRQRRKADEERLEKYKRDVGGRRNPRTDYKKAKSKLIMDQKANSIADLAAVLREQESIGATTDEEVVKEPDWESMATEITQLSTEAEDDGLKKTNAEIKSVRVERHSIVQDKAKREEHKKLRHTETGLLEKRRKMYIATQVKKQAFAEAKQDALEWDNKQDGASQQDETVALQFNLQDMIQRDTFHDLIQDFSTTYIPREMAPKQTSQQPLPKRGELRKKLIKDKAPVYTAEGVRIKWMDPLDAEYAENWPRAVQHDIVGIVRHALPKPDSEPVLDVEDMPKRTLRHWYDSTKNALARAAFRSSRKDAEALEAPAEAAEEVPPAEFMTEQGSVEPASAPAPRA